jgi:hypothetical protein
VFLYLYNCFHFWNYCFWKMKSLLSQFDYESGFYVNLIFLIKR